MTKLWKTSAPVWAFFERQTRFFRLGERVPLEDIMKGLSQMGFDGIELGIFDPAKDCSSEEIRRVNELLKRYKLEVPNLYVDIAGHWPLAAFSHPDAKVRRDVIQLLKTSLEAAKAFGAGIVGISPDCDGFPHPMGVAFKNAWNWMREGISECADAAADAGLKLAYEYKPKETRNFSLISNADTILRLIEQIKSNNLGVLLDTGHAMYAKEDLPTTVEKLDKALYHVHLCDNYGDWDDDLVPGTVHDFTQFFEALRRIGYNGFVGLDIYPLLDPFGECKKSKQYIDYMYSRLAKQTS
jgi:xylose isomerase